MPIDINFLRAEKGGDPDLWRQYHHQRFKKDTDLIDRIIAKDKAMRELLFTKEQTKREANAAQAKIGAIMKQHGRNLTPELQAEVAALRAEKERMETSVPEMQARVDQMKEEIDADLNKVGNSLDPSVPISANEDDNAIVTLHGTPRKEEGLLAHHELLHMIDGYEPERGVKCAGHRAYYLKGPGLMLNMALLQYGAQFLTARKYTMVQPPFFMNKDIMGAVAQLEEYDEALYKVFGEKGDEKYLIATSEQPLCAFHYEDTLTAEQLPIRYGGISPCFRKEAGSHGKDTWGIFRVHQFEKVEQFCITEPSKSAAMQDEMIAVAEEFYKSLGFAYRVVNIVSGALNNAAIKKLDLEAWFPGYDTYRELVSCSNCTDYQSRGMNIRFGFKGSDETVKPYVHMLNATLCATTRVLCCILENYQTPTGINVPEVLVPYCGGQAFIPFTREKPVNATAAKMEKAAARKAARADGKEGETPEAPAAPAPAAKPKPVSAKPSAAAGAPPPAVPVIPAGAAAGAASGAAAPEHAALNATLAAQSYINGFVPSAADATTFAAVGHATVDAAAFPHLARWARHIASFTDAQRAAWA